MPPELARVDMDLIPARDPRSHTEQLDSDVGVTYPISWRSLWGQKSKGTRDLFDPNLPPDSTLLPMESSDIPRHGFGHSAYCWIRFFRTPITPPLTARHWHSFLILQGCFT